MPRSKKPKKAEIQSQQDHLANLLRSAVIALYIEDRGDDNSPWKKTPGWEKVNDFGLETYRLIVAALPMALAQKLAEALDRLKPRLVELKEENRLLREENQRLKEDRQ